MMNAVEILTAGRDKIQGNGWYRGDSAGLQRDKVIGPAKDRYSCDCLATSVHHNPKVLRYILAALDLPYDPDSPDWRPVYKANDAQSIEDGPKWAIGVLDKAIELAKADVT
jgi:hypothetical protein